MSRDEVALILGIIKRAYPAFYKDLKKEEAQELIELWAMMFESDEAKIVTEAIKTLISTLKFPPTIADIKEKIYLITNPKTDSEMEAWTKVLGAIQNSNYYAKECFDELPEIIQKIVGSPNQLREWAMMESDVVNSVIQSNFMRSYKSKISSQKEIAMLPGSTKEMISSISNKLMIGA